MPKEYIKAKQVMVGASTSIEADIPLQAHLDSVAAELLLAGSYVWGPTISADGALTADDQNTVLRITANARLSVPKWADLPDGWWVRFLPEDNYKDSAYRVFLDVFEGGDIDNVTYPADSIRGIFEYINGDSVLVRSEVPSQFYVIGNAKYYTKEGLIAGVATLKALNWWERWYPAYFPAVPDAIAEAEVVIANPAATKEDIVSAGTNVTNAIFNAGIRVAFPCPYEFLNGDDTGANLMSSVTDILHDDTGHLDKLRFTLDSVAGGGTAVARQPRTAATTIGSLIGSPSQPNEFSQGTYPFSKFNEWTRAGSTVLGVEFHNDTPEEVDTTVYMRGEVECMESSVLTRYVLTASIGTEYISGTSTLESVCTLHAEKFVSGESVGVDTVTSRQAEAYSGTFPFGFYYSQHNGKVTFLTGNQSVELDAFTTSEVSTGLFSTAFSKIDSFGIWKAEAARNGFVRTTAAEANIDFIRTVHEWVLPFPETTKIDCASRLWRPEIFEAETSGFTLTVTPNIAAARSLSLINILAPAILEESATVSPAAVTLATNELSISPRNIELVNPVWVVPPALEEWTVAPATTTVTATASAKNIQVEQV